MYTKLQGFGSGCGLAASLPAYPLALSPQGVAEIPRAPGPL